MTHFGTQSNAFFLPASFRFIQMLRVVAKTTAKILQVGDCTIRFAASKLCIGLFLQFQAVAYTIEPLAI